MKSRQEIDALAERIASHIISILGLVMILLAIWIGNPDSAIASIIQALLLSFGLAFERVDR